MAVKISNITILIDIQNLYHSSLTFGGAKISYRKLIEKISEGRNLITCKAYAAHREIKTVDNFYKALEKLGVEVISRRVQVKKTNDKDGIKIIPVHFEVEIATDALTTPEEVDTVVLCTGNGNFEYLVDKLGEIDETKVEVWSFKESTSERLTKKAKFVQIPNECLLSTHSEEDNKEPAKVV